MRLRLTAFTLSELLVSLSILGLIAALTLPSIFNAVETQKKHAIFKETITTIQGAYYSCIMDGTCSVGDYSGLFTKLNSVTRCTAGDVTCRTSTTVQTGSTNDSGAIFANGAHFWGIQETSSHQGDGFAIDFNGADGSNTTGDDIILMARCNLDGNAASYPCTNYTAAPRQGKISVWEGASASETLYNEIYGSN